MKHKVYNMERKEESVRFLRLGISKNIFISSKHSERLARVEDKSFDLRKREKESERVGEKGREKERIHGHE